MSANRLAQYTRLLAAASKMSVEVRGQILPRIHAIFKGDQTDEAIEKETEQILNLLQPPVDKQESMNEGVKFFAIKKGQLTEVSKKEVQESERVTVDFSNWYGGNADPEDIKRHKQLMDRMSFKGPFWENRKKNPSIIDEENPRYVMIPAEQKPPEKEAEHSWETVKR